MIWRNLLLCCTIVITYSFLSHLPDAYIPGSLTVLPACFYGGFNLCAADWYWFRLLLIGPDLKPNEFYHIIDRITDCDEHYNGLYRYAMVASIVYQQQPHYAVSLGYKALRSAYNRQDWRVFHLAAFAAEQNNNQLLATKWYTDATCCSGVPTYLQLKSEETQ